jgi:hypothetical protein
MLDDVISASQAPRPNRLSTDSSWIFARGGLNTGRAAPILHPAANGGDSTAILQL